MVYFTVPITLPGVPPYAGLQLYVQQNQGITEAEDMCERLEVKWS
jgi:hypothetical protein